MYKTNEINVKEYASCNDEPLKQNNKNYDVESLTKTKEKTLYEIDHTISCMLCSINDKVSLIGSQLSAIDGCYDPTSSSEADNYSKQNFVSAMQDNIALMSSIDTELSRILNRLNDLV